MHPPAPTPEQIHAGTPCAAKAGQCEHDRAPYSLARRFCEINLRPSPTVGETTEKHRGFSHSLVVYDCLRTLPSIKRPICFFLTSLNPPYFPSPSNRSEQLWPEDQPSTLATIAGMLILSTREGNGTTIGGMCFAF